MNSSFPFKIVFSIILIGLIIGSLNCAYADEAKIEYSPYFNGITSVKDGNIELGAEINKKTESQSIILRPYFRVPLTDKDNSKLQLDRFTSTWRAILAMDYIKDETQDTGHIRRFILGVQGEWGTSEFKYHPDKSIANEKKSDKSSFDLEVKGAWFFTEGKPNASQWGPQLRVRYAKDWKEADATGVVVQSTDGTLDTVTNMRIQGPTSTPLLSPSVAFLYYPGKHKVAYTPALFYDLTGKENTYNPFNGSGRIRIEDWVFYFPLITDMPNVKIGLAPFASFRTHGSDNLDSVEYGGLFQVKFSSNYMQFY